MQLLIWKRQIFKTKVNKHRPKQSAFKCIKQGRRFFKAIFFFQKWLRKEMTPLYPNAALISRNFMALWWYLLTAVKHLGKNMERYTGRHWVRNMGRELRWSVVCLFWCIKHVRKIISTFLRKGYKQWKTNGKETKQFFFTVTLNKGGKGKVVNSTEAKYFGTILVMRNTG